MEDGHERAERIADRSSHRTVTVDLLTGRGRFANEFYLYDRPAVAHLDDGEQPHVALHNDRRGVGVGGKRNTRSPDGGGIAVYLFTHRRVLAVLGRSDGDERLTIPYNVVTDARYKTGIVQHRVVVETVDTEYHLWVDRGYEESDLRDAVELVRSNASGGQASPESTGASPPSSSAGGPTDLTDDIGNDLKVESDGGDRNGRLDTTDTDGGTNTTNTSVATDTDASTRTRTTGGEENPLDKLERLQELNKKGAITDAEFERKKTELLEQI